MTAGVQKPAPEVARLGALKLREPVRFYLWPAIAVQAAVLLMQTIAAAATGEWSLVLLAGLFGILLLLFATGAARASVFTVPGIQRAMREGQEL